MTDPAPPKSGPIQPAPFARAAKSLAWVGGAASSAVAAALVAVLAVVFTATVVVIGLIVSALVTFVSLSLRARRTVSVCKADDDLIEARNIGGHSWVAYGWDPRAR